MLAFKVSIEESNYALLKNKCLKPFVGKSYTKYKDHNPLCKKYI